MRGNRVQLAPEPPLSRDACQVNELAAALRAGRQISWLGCFLVLTLALAGCGKPGGAVQQAPPTVTVSQPRQEEVTDYLDLTGTVSPSRTVDLVARVLGYLESVDFDDGAMVESGKLLFVIEPEPYKEQLALAQAALLRAQSEYDRQVSLIQSNATSQANLERWLSERDQAAAQVALAKLNLGYTRVTAPFSGRIGRHLVDPGNLVGPGTTTKLATLEQIKPIYVYFNLNERDALRIAAVMRERGLQAKNAIGKKPVFVGLQTQEGYPEEGTLDFLGTDISTATGTLQMRAVFANTNHVLISGAFVRVRVPLGQPKPMLVVPNSAIGNDQEGDYVLVAGAGNVVARRTVVKGPLTPNGCAIRSGLAPEDRVVVNGIMLAKPGATVTPVAEPAGQSPAASTNL